MGFRMLGALRLDYIWPQFLRKVVWEQLVGAQIYSGKPTIGVRH